MIYHRQFMKQVESRKVNNSRFMGLLKWSTLSRALTHMRDSLLMSHNVLIIMPGITGS